MPRLTEEELRIMQQYGAKLESSFDISTSSIPTNESFSREYNIFRGEALSQNIGVYENLCNIAQSIIKVEPKPEAREKLQKAIDDSHLEITPEGAMSLATLVAIISFIIAITISLVTFILFGLEGVSIFFPLLIIAIGAFIIKPISNIPEYLASRWRLAASNQMVLCILYVVMYMRHTSNLEHAIKFAGEHVGNPLALDLRKVFWDVETGKYSTIKASLDNYLLGWRDYSLEFVESFHLIEESLYEPNEQKRIDLLEKSLEIMLEGTYDKMLNYAHDLSSPITMLHMLGVILPILGLVIFPLLASFLQGAVKWWHLALLYNIFLPLFVYFYGTNLLSKRPTGYSESNIVEDNPEYEQYKKVVIGNISLDPKVIGFFIGSFFVLIGLLPIIIHLLNPSFDFKFGQGALAMTFLDYKEGNIGPFGVGALIFSLFIPLGIALGYGTYCKLSTRNLIKIKEETNKLEKEFAGSLFQLGNRIGEGMPVELAFGRVAENLQGTPTGTFFKTVSINIRKLGMGVKEAIFNEDRGAIIYFPSSFIESSMKVLIESAKKGPEIVSKALISISKYFERINEVNRRLKDLLAEIISSMKSQISFLTPMIAGIVVGVASMVVAIINKLGEQFQVTTAGTTSETIGGVGQFGGVLQALDIKTVIPSYHFQLVVGLYVVQITIILTILCNSIERGQDKLTQKHLMGKNLYLSIILYSFISLIGIIVFNILAGGINLISS